MNEIEKNRLDLAYQRQLHYLNGVITFVTIGIVTFLGTFIWNRDYLLTGFIFVIISLTISYYSYKKIDKTLKGISKQIKKLS